MADVAINKYKIDKDLSLRVIRSFKYGNYLYTHAKQITSERKKENGKEIIVKDVREFMFKQNFDTKKVTYINKTTFGSMFVMSKKEAREDAL